ncbi:MAG: hypothetical protein HC899_12560 [Leptolyngbyaceae cyanobacterium SM1_4_3]|nr:hypothetical protein [Leptolyngbyaceae cyanobacterium SM1_4_3]NJN90829.1 hypothetical protein [Leptolyngbyaceae cyanobacterium SL_5_14]NJO66790.1 hypothetical protein [Leptolyngbyaceae cyanobacterium RM1_405_57]
MQSITLCKLFLNYPIAPLDTPQSLPIPIFDKAIAPLPIDRPSIHLFSGSDRPLRTNRDRSVFNWLSRSSKRVPSVAWSSGRSSGRASERWQDLQMKSVWFGMSYATPNSVNCRR